VVLLLVVLGHNSCRCVAWRGLAAGLWDEKWLPGRAAYFVLTFRCSLTLSWTFAIAGRSSASCSRLYHAGCLLLLNAAGIRTIREAKQPHSKQKARQQQSSGAPPGAAPAAYQDGLLAELLLQLEQPAHCISPAVAAAAASAVEASALLHDGQVQLCCPGHHCSGCGLNGKHEVRRHMDSSPFPSPCGSCVVLDRNCWHPGLLITVVVLHMHTQLVPLLSEAGTG
jgi:hypothetical protein